MAPYYIYRVPCHTYHVHTSHSHMYTPQMRASQEDATPITMLSILNHRLFPNDVPYLSFHQNVEASTQENHFNDCSYVFLELSKFSLKKDQLKTDEDHWIYMFKEATHVDTIPNHLPDAIRDAWDVLEKHTWSGPEKSAYFVTHTAMLDKETAIDTAMEKGREEGERLAKINMARSMLFLGISREQVLQITGLGEDEM
jgi:predicted transposase/invertase (TIGR01784 family)